MDILISVLVGCLGVPLINLLKRRLKLVDEAALLLTFAVSLILGAAVLFMAGMLTGESFTPGNLAATLSMVFTTAGIIYRLIFKEKTPEPAPALPPGT